MEPRLLFRLFAFGLCVRPSGANIINSLAVQFSTPGDFVIGGLFACHSKVRYRSQLEIPTCYSFYPQGYLRHLSMRFAIEEINNSTALLPGVKLGYEIHNTCNNELVATKPTLTFLSKYPSNGGLEVQCSYSNYKPRVIAVVGPDSSDLSLVLSRLLNFLSIPEISHAGTTESLSSTEVYPSFFRTIPSDKNQAEALVQLLKKFHWNWVAALATDDEYGRQALAIFVQLALSRNTCVAYEAILPSDQKTSKRQKQLIKITSQLVTSGINTTVVFAQPDGAEELMTVVVERGIVGKVWIASECWATSLDIGLIPKLASVGTIIGMGIKSGRMPGFPEYVRHILQGPEQDQNGSVINREHEQCPECGNLTLANLSAIVHDAKFYVTFNAYQAVYAIAHALHRLLQCNTTTRQCNADRDVYPWQLLEEIAKVNFTVESQPVYFSETGNPPTGYDLILWSWNTTGALEFVSIGSYDALQGNLTVDESKIRWHTGDKKECSQCAKNQWFLELNSTCQDRTIEYLEATDLLSVIMVALTTLALAQMAVITGIFAKYQSTPAVCYFGRSPALLIVLSSTGLCSSFFLFTVKPFMWVCKVRQPFFFVSFTVTLATLLRKAVQSSGLDRTLRNPLLRRHSLALCVLFHMAIQSLLCVFWYLWNPPSLEENTAMESTILLQCQDVSFPGFGLLLAYSYGLAVTCYICCFWGNNPHGQNKAIKSISFAMVLIIVVWTLFVPTYATSQGKFVSLFQVFAGLASIFAIFGSCYYQVCYIVLFAPHMNTDSQFRSLPQNPPAKDNSSIAEIK